MNAGCDPTLPQAGQAAEGDGELGYAVERRRMVATQLVPQERGIKSPQVLKAMQEVPRHEFVPVKARSHAYEDRPLSIGHGQTISQPFIVAFMTEALNPKSTDRVLEIGTGSGYQAAVMSRLVKEVYTIEIVEPLAIQAAADLKRLGYDNVHVRSGDGYAGWPEKAPFDTVIVTCAPDHVPKPLTEQLKEGGLMIIPVGGQSFQTLVLIRKEKGGLKQVEVLEVRFVPMTGTAEKD